MHRLYTIAAALTVAGAMLALHGSADAQQQRKRQAKPPDPPRVIIEHDWRSGPPQQPEPKYYGPAPTIQPPMRRVPQTPPLAQPPINR